MLAREKILYFVGFSTGYVIKQLVPRGDGSPRAIIARFLRYGDRELIFSNANKLKDTEYRISADLPKEIVHRRKLQSKKLVEARKAGKTAFFSRAEPDKLFIDGVLNSI